jgi:pilus assembly protein CpaC
MVEGSVASPRDAEAILSTLRASLPQGDQLIDRLTIATPTQVNIRVHVAEVSRSIDQRLGINWQALLNAGDFVFGLATGRDFLVPDTTGSGGFGNGNVIQLPSDGSGAYIGSFNNSKVNIDALIDALDQQGFARTLAQPNLPAVSGQKASFLAGGEFPIPVAQDDDKVTIEFKQFGVMLDFVPTVLAPDRISLTVRPEVSALSSDGAIVANGLSIPSLIVRRVETTVELGSGQSLALGGLLQQDSRDAVNRLPGLGDLPVLGSLFTSTSYQRNETELVVIVTPYIVRPTAPEELQTTLGRYAPARPLESLLLGSAGAAASGTTPRLNGPAGFIF